MIVGCAISAIVAGGLGFWGGQHFNQFTRGTRFAQMGNRGLNGAVGAGRPNASGQGGIGMRGGAVIGEVTAKDGKSLTVKLADGSSKIVILSDATTYRASSQSSLDKIEVGTKIAAQGASNADGTTIAASVEIDPLFGGRK